ncbi:MAG TPA: membrane protein insertase YidC [Candidatus Acidoferrales bacterium]|nr:membrane protein insertase YidC [Candidatus Acidoferrales bacterium]
MKELSPERRALLAGLLSLLVIIIWSMIYKPPAPPKPSPQHAGTETAGRPATAAGQPLASVAAPGPSAIPARAASEERTIVVESHLYRIELSNRGAAVRSWQLKKYTDDHKPPRTLDVVHPDATQAVGWPFSLALDDPQLEAQANSGLYVVTLAEPRLAAGVPDKTVSYELAPPLTPLTPPTELHFMWSDGRLAVIKHLKFDPSYVVEMETSVQLDGKPLVHGVAWRGGFGDTTVYMPAEQVQVFFSSGGKLQMLPYKKLGDPNQPAQRLHRPGTFGYVGIEDRYFAAAFLPRAATSAGVALWDWRLDVDIEQDGKTVKEPVAEMAARETSPGPLALRVFVGPKDLDELKKLNPPLTDLVQFGWLEIIAAPLFYLLRWLHGYVPNYGWAIILMTVLINMLLFPLKVKSWRSMQKMQKVAPEIRAIQDRYKKYSLRDPRKQEMNKEVMAVYQRENINPMGGCLPMVLQMPIWFALYRMLNVTIELRHAPWLGWIHDLSARDPYYILPVLMGVTMYAMQKMTPMTATDPAQQRMLNWTPLMFGAMFVIFPVSSGLVLYILASNLVNMAQQWYLNRSEPVAAKAPRGKEAKKR